MVLFFSICGLCFVAGVIMTVYVHTRAVNRIKFIIDRLNEGKPVYIVTEIKHTNPFQQGVVNKRSAKIVLSSHTGNSFWVRYTYNGKDMFDDNISYLLDDNTDGYKESYLSTEYNGERAVR